jgi:glucan phosphoethanolaminetransferase (alkaline phosphatase superfamily)
MASIIRLISLIVGVLFFIIIPAIPGAVLWWLLKPVMFWEKFAWVVTSMIFYVIIFLFIISFISDMIYKEEGEEEDENEE